MVTLAGKMKKPEPNKNKIIIIASVIAIVCLSAAGGLYFKFSGGNNDESDGRRPRFHDANLPDMHKQSYDDVMAYKNSDKYKNLSQHEQAMYSMMTFRQVEQHNVETYFTMPKDKQTAFLDKVIDDMQKNMKNMEQMRSQFQRPRDANDVNDPNAAKRREERMAQRNNPSNVRAMRERGDPEQRAQQRQFRDAMKKRMQQRGISMPTRGGGGGGPGDGGGRGGR